MIYAPSSYLHAGYHFADGGGGSNQNSGDHNSSQDTACLEADRVQIRKIRQFRQFQTYFFCSRANAPPLHCLLQNELSDTCFRDKKMSNECVLDTQSIIEHLC